MSFLEEYKKYLVPTYSPTLNFIRGNGVYLYDDLGHKYLDCSSGISVCNLGHSLEELNEVIAQQAKNLWHCSNLYSHNLLALTAKKIIEKTLVKGKVFFTNSGTESNEAVLKLIRKAGLLNNQRKEIICLYKSFHGRSYGSMSATGQEKMWKSFMPTVPLIHHIDMNDKEAFDKVFSQNTAGVLMELVLGEGGVFPLEKDFVQYIRQRTKQENVILAIDEIQTGMGRTGKYFSFQHYDIEPDVISIAKALGNGFPVGAMVVGEKFADTLVVGDHGSTFAGNPLAVAVVSKVFDIFERENIIAQVEKKAMLFKEFLLKLKEKFSIIEEVRQLGLMIGIQFTEKIAALQKICCEDFNFLVLSAGPNVLRLLPALNIKEEELYLCFERLEYSIEKFVKNL